jgi:hypothetical protein
MTVTNPVDNIAVQRFANEADKRAANARVLKNVLEVMFFWLEEDQENLDDDDQVEIFTDFLWSIAVSALSSTNINIIGKDENGRLIATIEPYESVKDFLIKEDIGEDDHVFYEDFLESVGLDSGFGRHDDKFMRS